MKVKSPPKELNDIKCSFCKAKVPKNTDKRTHDYLSVIVWETSSYDVFWPSSKVMCPNCVTKHQKVLKNNGYHV